METLDDKEKRLLAFVIEEIRKTCGDNRYSKICTVFRMFIL